MTLHERLRSLGIPAAILISFVAIICLVPLNFLSLPSLPFVPWLGFQHVLLVGFALALVVSSVGILREEALQGRPLFLIVSAWIGLAVLASSFLAPVDGMKSLKVAIGFVCRGLVPGVAAYLLARYRRKDDMLMSALLVIAGIVAFSGIYELITGHYFIFTRTYETVDPNDIFTPDSGFATGTLGHPLTYSLFLVFVLPLALDRLARRPGWGVGLVTLLSVAGIVLAVRRTGWGLAVLAIVAVVAVQPMPWKRRLSIAGVIALLLLILAVSMPGLVERARARFSLGVSTYERGISHRGRSQEVARQIFRDHKATGVGVGRYGDAQQPYLDFQTSIKTPDNQYFRVLAEGGIFLSGALIAFSLFLFVQLILNWRDPVSRALLIAFAVFYLNCWFTDGLMLPPTQIIFWTLAGLAIGRVERPLAA